MQQKKQNVLLQKTELGKVKPGFHQLPPEGHVYGKAPTKDKYGAREVVSGWENHKVSEIKQPEKNFVAMNKEGIKNGCIDSKQITNFRKDHEIKVQVKEGQKFYGVSIPHEQFTYGIPNRPSTPIKNVICNTYADQQLQLKKEREAVMTMISQDQKKTSPPKVEVKKPAQTHSNKKKEIADHSFKLSKFKNVQSKIKPLIEASKNSQQPIKN